MGVGLGAGVSCRGSICLYPCEGKTLKSERYATAAGTIATLAPGNQLCQLRDVQQLVPRICVERTGSYGRNNL